MVEDIQLVFQTSYCENKDTKTKVREFYEDPTL